MLTNLSNKTNSTIVKSIKNYNSQVKHQVSQTGLKNPKKEKFNKNTFLVIDGIEIF